MTAFLLQCAIAATRGWTRLYTSGMPAHLRERRRDEVESDLWECRHDAADDLSLARQIACRLLFGMIDDIRWRVESRAHARGARTIVIAVAAAAALAFLWIGLFPGDVRTPPPPAGPNLRWHVAHYPAPPPPPPPPCSPPGRPQFSPCTRLGPEF